MHNKNKMKRIYMSMLMMFMCISSILAADVKVTMNTVSTTMSLADKATGTAVEVGEPATRVYNFTAPAGTYVLTAYATDGTTINGTIEINIEDGVANEFSVLTCTAYASNSGWTVDNDYTVVANVTSKFGDARVHTIGNSITVGRKTFLALNGDSYNAELVPSDAHKEEGYMTLYMANTLTANANVNGAIAMGGDYSITVPSDANVYIGIKFAHFAPFKEIEASSIKTEGGNKVYTYRLADAQQYNFRTWKPGGLTQGGIFYYSTDATKCPTLAFTEADYAAKSPKFIDHDVKANGGFNVADIYLNINPQNHLKMNVGDKKDVTGFRTWQVVESTTNNYFLEPDYHYTLQSLTPGKTVEEIIKTERTDTNTDQWSTFTAVGKGTVLVTVTYDAIGLNQYDKSGVKSSFVGGEYWSAIWPENTGVFVVTVGEDAAGITPNFLVGNNHENSASEKLAGNNIDADFDVFYYKKGDAGYAYTFKPEGAASVKVAYPTIGANAATYAGFGTEGITDNGDGSYTVLLKNGRQIVALYDAAGNAQYQVLNAKEVEVTVENATRPGSSLNIPGDKVSVKFNTLFHPAHKLAGIHNFSATVDYNNLSDGATTTATGNQYMFAATDAAQAVTVTIPTTWTAGTPVTVDGGAIKVTGFGDLIGNHRNISRAAGRGANFTAVTHTCYFGVLPSTEIQVTEAKQFSVQLDFNPSDAKALVLSNAGKPVVPNKTTGKYEVTYGTYSIEAKAAGYRVFRSTFTIGDDAPDETIVPVTLVAGTEGMWDGTTKTEPTAVDGVYQIGTGAELAWFAATVNSGTYNAKGVLTADIDLGDFAWTPIGGTAMAKAFKGTFDGQGHTVKGLYINQPTLTYQGLFGYTYGTLAAPVTINNVIVEGEVTAKQYAAGIAAYMGAYVSMDCVGNKANVTSAGTYTGGVTGYVSAATAKITNAFNTGNITGTTNTGGVAGSNNATAVIENVYSVGNVIGTTVGAVLGGTTAKTNVKNAYAINEYGITAGQTTVTVDQLASGEIAFKLGDAWGQEIGVDTYPVLGGMKVYFDDDEYTNVKPIVLAVATLENEDLDYLALEHDSHIPSLTEDFDEEAGYQSGDFWFDMFTISDYGTWWGYGVANHTATCFKSLDDQYNSIVGKGVDGSDNYGVAYVSDFMGPVYVSLTTDNMAVVPGVYVTNSAYAFESMLSGDSYAKKFGQGDWFKLTATGFDDDEEETGSKDFYLADFRSEDKADWYIADDWYYMDLSTLGKVRQIQFTLSSTDNSSWGMNTPAYFCFDNFGAEGTEIAIPGNYNDKLVPTGISNVNAVKYNIQRFDLMGRRTNAAKGVQIIRMTDGTTRKVVLK